MKNIFQITLVALFAGVLAVSCAKEKDNDSAIEKPVMVSIAADPYFTDASATVTATIGQAVDIPVTVTLAADTKLAQDYTTAIDTDLISVGTITIPAGSTTGTTTVTVNNADMPKGKYETQIVATGSKGANLSSKNSANILLLQGVSTVSLSFDDYFDEFGLGSYTVALDMYSETDCVVKISQFEYPAKYTNVPADALTFESEVTIKAGETEATGYALIDLDALKASDFYVVGLAIDSVSEGSFEIGEQSATVSGMSFTLPVKNTDIEAEYLGRTVNAKGATVELFAVSGVGGYFDYIVTGADVEETNAVIYPNIFADENAYIAQYLGKYTLDDIVSNDSEGTAYITPKKREPGEYKLWIMAISEEGTCTGVYNTFKFTVEAEPEPTDAYSAWIGDWVVGSSVENDEPIVITISAQDVNKSYYIDGLEGVDTESYEISATGILEEDGSLSIYAQSLGEWEDEDYGPAEDVLAGLIYSGDKVYYVTGDELLLANGTLGADGKATLSAGTWYDSQSGNLYALMGMKYYWVVSAGAGSYSADYTPLPNILVRVEPEAAPEAFKKADIKVSGRKTNAPAPKRNRTLTNHIKLN